MTAIKIELKHSTVSEIVADITPYDEAYKKNKAHVFAPQTCHVND